MHTSTAYLMQLLLCTQNKTEADIIVKNSFESDHGNVFQICSHFHL